MDAVKFLKILTRMCVRPYCTDCPLNGYCGCDLCFDNPEEVIKIIEKWSKEHPVKTRMSEFMKQYPNAKLTVEGLPSIIPCDFDDRFLTSGHCSKMSCQECCQKYWLEEIVSDVADKAIGRDSFNFSQGQSTENDGKKVYVCDRNKYESLEGADENAVYFVVHAAPEETKKE